MRSSILSSLQQFVLVTALLISSDWHFFSWMTNLCYWDCGERHLHPIEMVFVNHPDSIELYVYCESSEAHNKARKVWPFIVALILRFVWHAAAQNVWLLIGRGRAARRRAFLLSVVLRAINVYRNRTKAHQNNVCSCKLNCRPSSHDGGADGFQSHLVWKMAGCGF